jgi:hypothetical protein
MPPQATEYRDEDDADHDDAFHDDDDDDDANSANRRTRRQGVATQKQTSQAASAWQAGKTHSSNASSTVSSDVCHLTWMFKPLILKVSSTESF